MGKPLRALPTYPQAQQQQQESRGLWQPELQPEHTLTRPPSWSDEPGPPQTTRIQPTLKWYKAKSRDADGHSRCPFVFQRCPRFYESVSLLGKAGFTTTLQRDRDDQLSAIWQRSDLWPRVREQAASIMGPVDDPHYLINFCPEVLYERFNLFATALHGYSNEIDTDSAHSQLAAEHTAASTGGGLGRASSQCTTPTGAVLALDAERAKPAWTSQHVHRTE